MKCRHCHAELSLSLADLGASPPSNSYLTVDALSGPETWYPLRVLVCERCWLAQTEDFAKRDEFFSEEYAYFSSFSTSWLRHAERYAEAMIERFAMGTDSMVVEVASNDGYLLQYFQKRGIPCLGIEPTESTAQAAREKGIEVLGEFFGLDLAERLVADGRAADLTAANNVLAHVPDINDFVAGFARLLKPQGVATFEFPHLLRLVQDSQFDTIYHEHYSYLSLTAVRRIFEANGLRVFDVETLPTHGGSLRVFATPSATGSHAETANVAAVLAEEEAAGLRSASFYAGLQTRAGRIADELTEFLLRARAEGKKVGAYGAAAKGNTLLNFAGVRARMIPWVVDRNPAKQGKFLPGSRIPIVDEEAIRRNRPDYIIIFPWNLKDEVVAQLDYAREWGARFVTAIPTLLVQ